MPVEVRFDRGARALYSTDGSPGIINDSLRHAAEHYTLTFGPDPATNRPAVRAARGDDIIMADGFSCREQIAQTTGRQALHLAQVLQMARHVEQGRRVEAQFPERAYPARQPMTAGRKAKTVALAAGTLGAGAALWWGLRRKSPSYGARH